jgi:general secretion pathway protein G
MPTSDLHHRYLPGFTLIEITVVLVLLGLISAIALPNLVNLYSSVERDTQLRQFTVDFNELGRRANTRGAGFSIGSNAGQVQASDPLIVLRLPENWQVEIREPIVFRANGACLGGSLKVMEDNETVIDQLLSAPFCQLAEDS